MAAAAFSQKKKKNSCTNQQINYIKFKQTKNKEKKPIVWFMIRMAYWIDNVTFKIFVYCVCALICFNVLKFAVNPDY